MAAGTDSAAAGDSSEAEFERIDGELDAAIVFAVAAEQAYQSGKPELAAACRSDAEDTYKATLGALSSNSDLSGAQLQNLMAKMIRLRTLLAAVPAPIRNEAA